MCATPTRHRVCSRSGDTPVDAGIWAARELVDKNGPSRSAKHARKRSATGLHIGRVGALAISLGVGFAIANGSGMAFADTESATSSAANATNDGEANGETRVGAKPKAGKEESGSDSPGGGQEDATEADPSESEDDVSIGDGDGSAGEGEDVEDGEGAPQLPDTDSPEEAPAPSVETVGSDGAPDAPAPGTDATTERADESTSSVAEAAVIDVGAEPATVVTETVVPIADAEGGSDTVVPTASPELEVTQDVGAVDVLSAVVSSVLAPLNDPATPARAPWFDGLLAWVRRQITHTFFNESPEWGPVTAQQLLTGQVVVDLNAVDPNGDPLTFKITQPEHGVVLRDPITGNFVYTPTTVVTGAPLIDSFTVVISDSSEHLKGLLGVIQGVLHFLRRASGLAEPDEVTLTIPVTVNPIVELAPVVVVTPVGAGIAGEPITVSPIVVITDLDSEELTSATVTLDDPGPGQILEYGSLPSGVTANYSNGVLTFTGAATLAAYQDLLASVTLTTPTAAIKTVSFRVVDDQNKTSLPTIAVITVVGLPVEVPPLVVVSPVATGVAGQPITISPIVVITDLDSDLESATVTITDPADGDVLSWGEVPDGFDVTTGAGSVTFSGAASAAVYQQILQSVRLTSTGAGLKLVSFAVTDVDGNPSVVPAGTVVTVVGLPVEVPPLVVVTPVATGVAGQAITISPIVVITDLDSDIESATVTIADPADGDVLSWGEVPDGFAVSVGAGSVTFSGAASAAAY
ncbi:hypothetical protein Mspyr1_10790 [Mycolicibacterium gilvum Spyr1]|uniref:Uncharacterized protein n=1 Tax=Mycolicibacterium gilvum (strain DSM 45189 / LMG 24558 / Spyr1) TaxID=278137 RepID=E6TFX1_MYCSR|nr:hypothetical protein Mspyr1_10790 [Mycolicibacterium gilvum Spyr1]